MRFRGVLLDFYGTLVSEDDDVIRSICEDIAAESGRAPSDVAAQWGREFAAATAGATGREFRPQRDIAVSSLSAVLTGIDSDLDADELCTRQFAFWRAPALREGSLEFLRSCELPICIVSNIDRDDLEAAIENHRLPLSHLVTSEDVRAYKPDRAPFEAGLKRLDLDPSEVLHIGDSLSADIAGANALGIAAAWVTRGGRVAPATARIDYEVADLRDLLPVLAPAR
ncbi:HAD-IA family hydrolase [Rathayibacter sp. VKM Ac-2759]|uniref:HAD family hydrolase n=1 Tax=Rathayibacter sp. VKM Ac-2759 TaxID=2609252 RepID=UPI001316CADF|nr:HAD family hydrolase [Rathayibacter sp. VKM Ac-2759]QHC67890.1 HAD-IA family hydrolase [Rathayibacter sp. VKM Ac-2759]